MCYADGCAVMPACFIIDETTKQVTKPDGSKATETEIEAFDQHIDKFYQKKTHS